MKELIPEVVDILSEKDLQFTKLHGTQDTVLSMGRKRISHAEATQFMGKLYTENGSKN